MRNLVTFSQPRSKIAEDRPAIAVGHAALERRIDFTRRRGDRRAAERLHDVAIDRRDADLQAGKIDLVDLLVEIDVERHRDELAGEIIGIELLVVQFVDIGPGAVLRAARPSAC